MPLYYQGTSPSTSGTTSTSGAASTIWYNWCDTQTIVTTATTLPWAYWCNNNTSTSTVWINWQNTAGRIQTPTAEQEAERKERHRLVQEEIDRKAAAEKLRKETADKKAEELLTAHLDEQQLADYKKFGCFNVRTFKGRDVRVRKARVANLDLLNSETGKVSKKLCVHPLGDLPYCDIMLAQKLMLEGGEEDVLFAKANQHNTSEPLHAVPPLRKVA